MKTSLVLPTTDLVEVATPKSLVPDYKLPDPNLDFLNVSLSKSCPSLELFSFSESTVGTCLRSTSNVFKFWTNNVRTAISKI